MLTQFGFRRKIYYLCTSEEEEALNMRVFSSFLLKKRAKKGCFTLRVGDFTLRREFFLGVCGFFLSNVGVRGGDCETFSCLIL